MEYKEKQFFWITALLPKNRCNASGNHPPVGDQAYLSEVLGYNSVRSATKDPTCVLVYLLIGFGPKALGLNTQIFGNLWENKPPTIWVFEENVKCRMHRSPFVNQIPQKTLQTFCFFRVQVDIGDTIRLRLLLTQISKQKMERREQSRGEKTRFGGGAGIV